MKITRRDSLKYAVIRVLSFSVGGVLARPEYSFAGPVSDSGHILVNGGEFAMGSPSSEFLRESDEAVRRVTVDSFDMGKYAVTQKEYRELMGSNPSEFQRDDAPVENVTWYEAVRYCNAKSTKEGLAPAYSIDALASYRTFVLASIHLGFYRDTMVKRFWPRRSAPLGTILKISAAAAAIWGGLYQCTERNIGSKLILYYSFDFWHTSEAAISYMASYLAIMVFFAFSAYYLLRIKKIFAKAPETLGRLADKAAEPTIFKNISGIFYGTKAKKSLSGNTAR